MTAHDPLEATFHIRDEALAYQLDRMIAYEASGDPDAWFNALLAERVSAEQAAIPARLAALAAKLSGAIAPDAVAAWDGTVPANPPPRSASARAPRINSDWRTR